MTIYIVIFFKFVLSYICDLKNDFNITITYSTVMLKQTNIGT